MSNPYAIAAVTATLRNLLHGGLKKESFSDITEDGAKLSGDIQVTTFTLDKANEDNRDKNGINLFLYQTAFNAALRNMDMPRQVKSGEAGQPPLALNLYYLISSYGEGGNETISHLLLGQAMSILYDHPVLQRAEIEDALKESQLQNQVEHIRITPQPMPLEAMSQLWMTFQTQYRISAAYLVEVVLIDSTSPVKAALPVLTRGQDDRGVKTLTGSSPILEEVRPTSKLPSVRLGEELTLSGQNLAGDSVQVEFKSQRLEDPFPFQGLTEITDQQVTAKLPDPGDPNDAGSPDSKWPAGFYTAKVISSRTDEPDRTSNELVFSLAPRITTVLPKDFGIAADNAGGFNVIINLDCSPHVLPEQQAVLLLNQRNPQKPKPPAFFETLADSRQDKTNKLRFKVKSAEIPADQYYVRLRVDGVDSLLMTIDATVKPPVIKFDENQTVNLK
jgi:hypothetical protein